MSIPKRRNMVRDIEAIIESNKEKHLSLIDKIPMAKAPAISQQSEGELKYKKLYKDMKKAKLKAEKDLENIKNEKSEKKSIHKDLQNENQSLKEKLFVLEQSHSKLSQELNSLKNENKKLDSDLKTKDKLLNKTTLRADKYTNKTGKVLVNLKALERKIHNLKKANRLLNEKLIREKAEGMNSANQIKKYKKELAHSNQVIKSFEEEAPATLIGILDIQLNQHSLHRFGKLTDLFTRYQLINEQVTSKKEQESLQIEVSNTIHAPAEVSSLHEDVLYGIIRLNSHEEPTFVDTDNIQYNIDGYCSYKDGTPVTARLVGKFMVKIDEKLRILSTAPKRKKVQKKKTIKKSESSPAYNYGQGTSVLLLTSKLGNKYRDFLNKHGFNATWHNVYEKSPEHTKVMMDKFDIVLIFWDATPHMTLNFVLSDSNKYQFIKTGEEEKVLHRAYFTGRELNLIEDKPLESTKN
jgi:hypothetical protein